ncbi:MAG: hypothetical protein GY832_11825, partial [Chloroflexi bacterium]|nr:hypothetical protein [Chloroflexota bacterium]
LCVETDRYDDAFIRVSTDGSNWTTIWDNPSSDLDGGAWEAMEYDISAIADDQATVYIRWTMGDTDNAYKFCGWNIDDVEIEAIGGSDCEVDEDCDDGISCTDDFCNETTGSCDFIASNDGCDDGLWCNGDETCNASVGCEPADPADACPGQYCNEEIGCYDCNVDDDCDNDLFCDGVETCLDGSCQAGTVVSCDDGVGCTVDTCNESTDECNYTANDTSCDDGTFCNGSETCNASVGCEPADPADACPGQYCNEDIGCYECNVDKNCQNELFCDGVETCLDGSCQAGSDPCGGQECNESTDTCISGPSVKYSWNMDTDPGWTTEDQWAWGQPTGGGGEHGENDPSSGATGNNVYGYNLSGDYANSLSESHLTTTAIDCTGFTDTKLKFQRWLCVE